MLQIYVGLLLMCLQSTNRKYVTNFLRKKMYTTNTNTYILRDYSQHQHNKLEPVSTSHRILLIIDAKRCQGVTKYIIETVLRNKKKKHMNFKGNHLTKIHDAQNMIINRQIIEEGQHSIEYCLYKVWILKLNYSSGQHMYINFVHYTYRPISQLLLVCYN